MKALWYWESMRLVLCAMGIYEASTWWAFTHHESQYFLVWSCAGAAVHSYSLVRVYDKICDWSVRSWSCMTDVSVVLWYLFTHWSAVFFRQFLSRTSTLYLPLSFSVDVDRNGGDDKDDCDDGNDDCDENADGKSTVAATAAHNCGVRKRKMLHFLIMYPKHWRL